MSLLNLSIVDASKTLVNVALWGAQAETFPYRKGCVMAFFKVKNTNFDGCTLNVLKSSTYVEVKKERENDEVDMLTTWYTTQWQKK